jgi:hypothetical protein
MLVSSIELIQRLEKVSPDGFQISYRHGILNSTKAIYIRKEKIYLFNMEDKFSFRPDSGYEKNEFIEIYNGCSWILEDVIG